MSLENNVTDILNLVRLHRLKSKIIAISLLATLIPSVTMGWLSYQNNRRVLREKVAQELVNFTSHSARGLDFWFSERQHELRVFASSYEVSENLQRISEGSTEVAETALGRLSGYLGSVSQRVVAYEELLVVDIDGGVVASSESEPGGAHLPGDWLERLTEAGSVGVEPYWDERLGTRVIPMAVIVRDPGARVLGGLLAKLNLSGIAGILAENAADEGHRVHLVTREGLVLASSTSRASDPSPHILDADVAAALFDSEGLPHEFDGLSGTTVVGTLERIQAAEWGVVAEQDRKRAFAPIARLRNLTILLVLTLLVVVGLAAYALGLTIVRPLDRLTGGATRIALGDMDVDLPVRDEGEVGYMTRVFNDMAKRLRELVRELDRKNQALLKTNQELHELSIRDPLTGLYNHKHMMETLATENARAVRYEHPYSILMIDIDNFKNVNDKHGHQVGDEALIEVGRTIRETLRAEDYAARYGGEEFLVMLPETGCSAAAESAERLRRRIAEKKLGAAGKGSGITVSIGVASFPENGADPDEVVRQADNAMYGGKRAGRNRVVIAGDTEEVVEDEPKTASSKKTGKRRRSSRKS